MINNPDNPGGSPFTAKELDYNNAFYATSFDGLKSQIGEFGEKDVWAYTAGVNLRDLLSAWKQQQNPAWSLLKGARVLDVGSGAYLMRRGGYPPHFARLCAMNGADVTGIDIKDQSPWDLRLFKGVKADVIELLLSNGLSNIPQLQGQKFDIVYSHGLVGGNPPDEVKKQFQKKGFTYQRYTKFQEEIRKQLAEFLNENGVMTISEDDMDKPRPFTFSIYKKVNGLMEKVVEKPK